MTGGRDGTHLVDARVDVAVVQDDVPELRREVLVNLHDRLLALARRVYGRVRGVHDQSDGPRWSSRESEGVRARVVLTVAGEVRLGVVELRGEVPVAGVGRALRERARVRWIIRRAVCPVRGSGRGGTPPEGGGSLRRQRLEHLIGHGVEDDVHRGECTRECRGHGGARWPSVPLLISGRCHERRHPPIRLETMTLNLTQRDPTPCGCPPTAMRYVGEPVWVGGTGRTWTWKASITSGRFM